MRSRSTTCPGVPREAAIREATTNLVDNALKYELHAGSAATSETRHRVVAALKIGCDWNPERSKRLIETCNSAQSGARRGARRSALSGASGEVPRRLTAPV